MKRRILTTIRIKLILSLISVVIITGISSIIVGSIVINDNIIGQAKENVRANLSTAQYIYNNKINTIDLFVNYLASQNSIRNDVINRNRISLESKLKKVMNELNLNILNITDANGRIIIRGGNPSVYGDVIEGDIYIDKVLKEKKSFFGSDIISFAHLLREGKKMADQAFIGITPTKMVRRKLERQYEDRGLLIKAASPMLRSALQSQRTHTSARSPLVPRSSIQSWRRWPRHSVAPPWTMSRWRR